MRFISCCILFGLLCGDSRAQQGESAQELKAKLLSEWESVGKSITTSRVEAMQERSSSLSPPGPLSLSRKTTLRFVHNQKGCSFLESEELYNEKGKSQERYNLLRIWNDSYQAELKKTRGGDGWLLSKFEVAGKDRDWPRMGLVPWLSLFDNGTWVPDWVRDRNFVITRSEPLPSASTLRIHFKANIPNDVKVGHLDVDPLHSYRISGYDCHVSNPQSEQDRKGRLEYENGPGVPVLKGMTEETPLAKMKKGHSISARTITTYMVKYDGAISDDEFRLSYYGLPEPGGPAKKPVRWYLWILCAAGACATMAFALRYMRRRAAAKA
jgi:hypothetical protein